MQNMTTLLLRASGFLASHSSLYVIVAAIVAFLIPETFAWVKGDVSSTILGIIMLTMGLTLTTEDFRELFRRPLDIFIGACAQYTLMPLIAWTLTQAFQLNPYLSIGIILVGCCPGGRFKQYYVIPVSWRCGILRRHDYRLYPTGSAHDTPARLVAGR